MYKKDNFTVRDREGMEIREGDKVAYVGEDGKLESGFVDLILAEWDEVDEDIWPWVDVKNVRWKKWKDVEEMERVPDEMWVYIEKEERSEKIPATECVVIWKRR